MSDKNSSGVDAQRVISEDVNLPQSAADAEQQQAAGQYGQQAGAQTSMLVKVHSPFQDYFEGQAFSVSAVNATGPFDVLPQHHSFISLLTPCELVIRTEKASDNRRISISGGIMQVKADKVIVFLDV